MTTGAASHTRPSAVILTDAETARFHRAIAAELARGGTKTSAIKRFGLSTDTFDAAAGYGRMQRTTRERVLAALDREGVA